MLAYSFPLFGIFVSLLFLFIWVVWLVLLFRVVSNVVRSQDLERMRASEAAVQDYIRSTVAGPSGTADELAKLADLHPRARSAFDSEVEAQKTKLLA